MALKIIDDACCRREGKLCIVVEGANPEEVTSSAAKQMAAEKAATCGYVDTGFSSHSGAYPVDPTGKPYDTDEKMAALTDKLRTGEVQTLTYRNDILLRPRI